MLNVIFLNMISYYEIQPDNNYLFPNNGVCDINYEIMKRNIETFKNIFSRSIDFSNQKRDLY